MVEGRLSGIVFDPSIGSSYFTLFSLALYGRPMCINHIGFTSLWSIYVFIIFVCLSKKKKNRPPYGVHQLRKSMVHNKIMC